MSTMTACVVVGLLVLVALGAVLCLRRREPEAEMDADDLTLLLLFLATLVDD